MASPTAEQVICQRAWNTLAATPARMKNPIFDKFFPNQHAIIDTFRQCRPSFDPALIQLLQSPHQTPPTFQQLKDVTAIEPTREIWGVYLLFLEIQEEAAQAGLYTGSAANAAQGATRRFQDYQRGYPVPAKVKERLDLGFDITHQYVNLELFIFNFS